MPNTQVAFTPLGGYFSVCVTALDIGEVFYSDGWDKARQIKSNKADEADEADTADEADKADEADEAGHVNVGKNR
jgi:hypothetical protein